MQLAAIPKTFEDHPHLRVLFYFDAGGAHEEALTPWPHDDIECVKVGPDFFRLKYRLLGEWKDRRVLLYFPYARPEGRAWERFPLLGLYHANRELSFDEAVEFLQKYDLPEKYLPLIRRYEAQLSLEGYQKHLAEILDKNQFSEARLQQGLISYLLGFERYTEVGVCLLKLLIWSGEPDRLAIFLRRAEEMELTALLRDWLRAYFNEGEAPLVPELFVQLAGTFKYNILMRNLPESVEADHYRHLRIPVATVQHKLWTLFRTWQEHPAYSRRLEKFWTETAAMVEEQKILSWYGTGADYGYLSRVLKRAVIEAEMPQVAGTPARVKERMQGLRDRLDPHDELQPGFELVWHAASMFHLLNSYASFRFNTAAAFVEHYTRDLYRVDLHYRKAVKALGDTKIFSLEGLGGIADSLHQAYDDFLVALNNEWLQLLDEQRFDFASLGLPLQRSFFSKYIQRFEYKAVVIISDALRYECAQELMADLISDKRNEVQLDVMLASVPSVTALGMAQLLPHKQIEIETDSEKTGLNFRIAGMPTQSLEQRSAILRGFSPESGAFTYRDIKDLDRSQGRELLKPYQVVYIYHNRIDAIGDKRNTEDILIDDLDNSLSELRDLIVKLTDSWNRGYVFLTADHGFIYNHLPLKPQQKEAIPKVNTIVQEHQRYIVAAPGKEPVSGYRAPLRNTSGLDTELEVILPRAVNRFIRSGHGTKFVHGGASLQELLVPALQLYRKRKDKREQVGVRVLPETKEIRAGALKLNLLQEEAVSNRLTRRSLRIGLYNEANDLLSNEVELTLESTATTPRERTVNLILNLTAQGSQASMCQLRVFDTEDIHKMNPLFDQRMIIKALYEKDDF